MSGPARSEFELIARYFSPLAAGFPGAYGLLDDAAVISAAAGHELVVKTDVIVAGIDFPPETPADLIARKALRVNLSDLAGKGAVPRAYLVDLIVPNPVEEAWIASFAAGLEQDQAAYSMHLIGGDTSSTSGPITVAVTVFGEVPVGAIIRRGGACAGDRIFVTGTIGDAALGLCLQRGALPGLDPLSSAHLLERYRLPQPRVSLGPRLLGIASASADVSDGLIADLGHICCVSNLCAVVEGAAVPLSAAAVAATAGEPERFATALTGGDDYEVVFTAPPHAEAQLQALSRSLGIPIAPIGHMVKGPPPFPPDQAGSERVVVLDKHGQPLRFNAAGWTHFGGG